LIDLEKLTDTQKRLLDERERIARQFPIVLAEAKSRGVSHAKAAAIFLASIQTPGEKTISLSTIYRWARGYKDYGRRDLIDFRWQGAPPEPATAAVSTAGPAITVTITLPLDSANRSAVEKASMMLRKIIEAAI
jgi:hypothetical protein